MTEHCHHTHHEHSHMPADYGRAFIIGITLNSAFILAEIIYGLKANSLALLADAGHNISDVLGLFMAWGATLLAKHKPSHRFTYGLQSSSIIAALGNALLLLVVVGGMGWEALQRLVKPEPVQGLSVIIVAGLGILINGITAYLFASGRKDDLNIRGAYLHMAADAAMSFGVVISGIVILGTNWLWLDPAVSLAINIIILWGTWALLKNAVTLTLHAVPEGIDSIAVKHYLNSIMGVKEVHDLHIWAMSTKETALTVHLLMSDGHPGDDFIKRIARELEQRFRISHVTVQIELGDTLETCRLAPDHVV